MISNLPEDWKVEKLENITEFLTCGVAKRPEYVDKENGIPFLSSKNAKANRLILNDYNYVSREDFKKLTKYYKPQRGDILYTRVGSFGEAVVINIDLEFAIFVSLTIMRAKPDIVNNYYLSNILNSENIKQLAKEKARGIGVKNLNVGDVRNFEIPIPPLEQQEKIVKVLDLTSNLIEKQKELLEKYDLFLKSKFIEMFGDPIKNPKGWVVVKLGNITDKITDGTHKTPKYQAEGIKFVSAKNIKNEHLNFDNCKYISENEHNDLIRRCNPEYKNILLTKSGSIGMSSIVPNVKFPFSLFESLCLIKFDIEKIEPFYLREFLNSNSTKYQYKNLVKGIAIKHLHLKDIRSLKIPIPPIELQNKFASIVEKIETIKEKENKKLKQLEDLHNSLMQKAFKGEIG